MISASPALQKSSSIRYENRKKPGWTLDHVLLATRGRLLFFPRERRILHDTQRHIDHNLKGSIARKRSLHSAAFSNISTDTRTLRAGDIFLALLGSNFDGTTFIGQAIKKGAHALIVSNSKRSEIVGALSGTAKQIPVILVDDTLQALGDLAAYRRSLMPDLRVIAITGSSGKTTVKEMTAAIFSKKHQTLKTKGNYNNLIGLPLSLLEVEPRHKFAILEMGMNQTGEIARLTEIADPDAGCITNIQAAHLAGLNSIKGVAHAKNELFAGMKSWGKLIVNNDDSLVRRMAKLHRNEKILYAASSAGRRQGAFIYATHIKSLGEKGMAFTLHIGNARRRISMKAIGYHNVSNAMAAASMAYSQGLNLSEIDAGLADFKPFDKRAQIIQIPGLDLKIINDSYNANPASMLEAVKTLQLLKHGHKAIAFIGDMFELGDASNEAHQALGKSIAQAGIDYLAATGDFAGEVIGSARLNGIPVEQCRQCHDKKEMAAWLLQLLKENQLDIGDWLLLKGSRGMQMETILEDLKRSLRKDQ